MEKQLIISVSREFGSGGHEIASELARRFNLPLYDKNILEQIACKHNLNIHRLEPYDEAPKNIFTSRNVRGFSNSPEEQVAQMQFRYLRSKAEAGDSFVALGRCSEEILKDYPCLVSIFVLADIAFKKERTMARDNTSEEEALELMSKADRRRKYYHNQHCRGKWGDSRNYDLCVNSAKLGIEGTTKLLDGYIRERCALM